MKIGRDELTNCLIYQIGALKGFLEAEGMALNHIKPHGSLYGMAGRDPEIAHAVADAADVFHVPIFGIINSLHQTIYPERGHEFVGEYYADLDYSDEGLMIITRDHPAVDPATAAARCLRAVTDGRTESVNGKEVNVKADSICIHSDTPNAVAVAEAVAEALRRHLNDA
jgi:UPF0271 protein